MGSFAFSKSARDSLLVHALLVLLTLSYVKLAPTIKLSDLAVTPNKDTVWIEVDTQEADFKNQLVQTLPGQKIKEPVKDAFLGEHTQVVDRQETRAASSMGELAADSKKTSDALKPKPAARKQVAVQPETPPLPSLDQLGVKLPTPKKTVAEQIQETTPDEEGSMTGQAGGEFVKGFKEGERTLLNTKEYVFFTYFQRVRKSLDKAWDRTLRAELDKYFKRGRQLASQTDYVTQLMVFLDHGGQIKKIRIMSESGTIDLDDAAIKAFNKAGPFPNPPKGLVDSSGQVKIRWDFVLRT
ncbi:MAG: TonB family protein [Proteobacteria bacterium]|nr:MAG: TonB family protein [Pseudomonadota bacterium]